MFEGTVAVALGSGGAKGLAHIGVLKALDAHGVAVQAVAGSSMGSLVGAFYATGMDPGFMERLACTLRWRHWADFTVPKVGLMTGEKVHQLVRLLTKGQAIDQAEKRLAIVATELLSRQSVVFHTGSIADAVRASISIPGVFVPYTMADGIYVDGGVLDRVPVAAARAFGTDLVIAVDVAVATRTNPPETIMDVILQSLDVMQAQFYQGRLREADITIEPELSHIGTSQFHRARQAIAAGYEATVARMDDIRACLEARAHRA